MPRSRILAAVVAGGAAVVVLGLRLRDSAIDTRDGFSESSIGVEHRPVSRRPLPSPGIERLDEAERAKLIDEAASLNQRAVVKDRQNDLRDAVVLFRQAAEMYRQVGRPSQTAAVLHDLGDTLSLLGKLPEALDALEEARQLRQAAGEAVDLGTTLTEIGWVHYLGGDAAKAVEVYREALGLMRSSGRPEDESGVLDRLGSAYRQLGRWQDSLASYEQALELCRQQGNRHYEASTLNNLAELFEAWGRPDEALETNGRALELFQGLPIPDTHGLAHTLYVRARALSALGELEAARRHSEEALSIVEGLRQELKSQALSQPFFAMRQIYFESYLDQLMALHERQPDQGYDRLALAASERSRARGLLDTFPGSGGVTTPDEALQQRKVELGQKIHAREQARRRLGARGSPVERAALEKELRELMVELSEVETRIREGGGVEATVPVLGVAEIQALLDQDTLLLSYQLGKQRSYLWSVDEHQVRSHVLPPGPEIEVAVRRFRQLLPHSHLAEGRDQIRLVAAGLGRLLLGPVQQHLGRQRLVLIGDGALHGLPFSALPDPETGAPLLARHEIVRISSASILAALRQRAAARPIPERTLAIFADPVFGAGDPRVVRSAGSAEPAPEPLPEGLLRSARDLGLGYFSRLPAARREAEAIAALLPPEQRFVALDFAASSVTATSGLLARFRILHFATHGLLHPLHPELSGIVLSLVDEKGRRRDGFLHAHEIADLDLAADLVVLSACKTALGTEMRGEGLLGLPRSLMYAGATRVVVSLWAVDDSATAELMTRFYRELFTADLPPAGALRVAQLSMAQEKDWRDPYYWAGFELQGDW